MPHKIQYSRATVERILEGARAGDQFAVVENEARAREITEYRVRKRRETLGQRYRFMNADFVVGPPGTLQLEVEAPTEAPLPVPRKLLGLLALAVTQGAPDIAIAGAG